MHAFSFLIVVGGGPVTFVDILFFFIFCIVWFRKIFAVVVRGKGWVVVAVHSKGGVVVVVSWEGGVAVAVCCEGGVVVAVC